MRGARGPCQPCFDLDPDLRAGNRDEQMAERPGRAGPHPRRTRCTIRSLGVSHRAHTRAAGLKQKRSSCHGRISHHFMTPQQSTELLQAITFLTIVMLFINIAKKYEENINVMESGLMFFILLLNISSSSNICVT